MKIMVVDDSIVFRSAISQSLYDAGLEVAKTASNGKIAVDLVHAINDFDLIIIDLEMPVMDGLTAIEEIRKINKEVTIIVFSSQTMKGVEKTFQALNAGANDFLAKPTGSESSGIDFIKAELIPKVLAFKDQAKHFAQKESVEPAIEIKPISVQRKVDLLIIGCSTGGPDVLGKIFRDINIKLRTPVLIVQHMPPMFTEKLAENLNSHSPLTVVEAKEGMMLQPNHAYIAPGDWHMLTGDNQIHLNQDERVCFVRPSVDVLLRSAVHTPHKKIAIIVLTGMGEDGAAGCSALNSRDVDIYIQDKESSVVWGMPGAVHRAVPTAEIIQLKDMATLIMKIAG